MILLLRCSYIIISTCIGPFMDHLQVEQFPLWGRVQLKCDGTRRHPEGELKGKLANGVGSQYPSLPRNVVYPALLPLMRTPQLPVVDWTEAPADLNGLIRFAERRNLVSARVPSHFKRSLNHTIGNVQPEDGLWKGRNMSLW